MMFLKYFAIFSIVSQAYWLMVQATNGVDVSTAVSEDEWKCVVKEEYTFAIVRVYQSNGKVDANAAATIKNAKKAGVKNVDGYIFPCFKCGNPGGQVEAAMKNLKSNGADIGMLWLDVEAKEKWSKRATENLDFIQGMVDGAKKANVKAAIYTSQSQWSPITRNSKQFSDLQLWYSHYDKKPNFSDFKPFGGWTKPAIKQFQGTTTVCNVGVDKNWYP